MVPTLGHVRAIQASPGIQGAGTQEPQMTPPILGPGPVRCSRISTEQDRSLPHKRAILAPTLCATLLCVPLHWSPSQGALRLNYIICVIQAVLESLGAGCTGKDHIQ